MPFGERKSKRSQSELRCQDPRVLKPIRTSVGIFLDQFTRENASARLQLLRSYNPFLLFRRSISCSSESPKCHQSHISCSRHLKNRLRNSALKSDTCVSDCSPAGICRYCMKVKEVCPPWPQVLPQMAYTLLLTAVYVAARPCLLPQCSENYS